MTQEALSALASQDINSADTKDLADISRFEIDRSLALDKRLDDFLLKVKNPYLFKVGDLTVKIKMKENGTEFKTALLNSVFSIRGNLPV